PSGTAGIQQFVNQGTPTSTTVSSTPNTSTFGQSVTLTGTITGSDNGGTVTFMDGSTALNPGGAPLDSQGIATFSTSALSAGTHSITAVYSGDTNYTTSTSPAITRTVNKASSSTAASSNQNPSTFGQSVTFTATVTGQPGVTGPAN